MGSARLVFPESVSGKCVESARAERGQSAGRLPGSLSRVMRGNRAGSVSGSVFGKGWSTNFMRQFTSEQIFTVNLHLALRTKLFTRIIKYLDVIGTSEQRQHEG